MPCYCAKQGQELDGTDVSQVVWGQSRSVIDHQHGPNPNVFSILPRATLEASGAQTVNVHTSTSSTMQVTVAVTVTASGDMLPPLFVFKGKPGGQIEQEFSTYEPSGIYSVQKKALMDEPIML